MEQRKTTRLQCYSGTVLLLAVIAFVAVLASQTGSRDSFRLLDSPRTVLRPILWGHEPETSAAHLRRGTHKADPLLQGMHIVAVVADPEMRRSGEHLSLARRSFDEIMAARGPRGYWPHPAYASFPEGWYSAMDFASVALAGMALTEATGDERFIDEGQRLIGQMLRPVDDGGAVQAASGFHYWLGEYVWPGMKPEDQTHVLNGYFYGLHALLAYHRRFPARRDFRTFYRRAADEYARNAGRFLYAQREWAYYMLRPPTPNQAHYLIYEVNQLDALHALDGRRTIYAEEAKRRRAIFQSAFPVIVHGGTFKFSEVAPPHPFYLDIYMPRLLFYDAGGALVGEYAKYKRDKQFLHSGPVPASAAAVSVRVFSGPAEIEMYRAPLVWGGPSPGSELRFSAEPIFDLEQTPKGWRISPGLHERPEGRLILTFDPPVTKPQLRSFVLDLTVSKEAPWGIGFYDKDNRQTFRYLPKLTRAGRVLMPLSLVGFNTFDQPSETLTKAMIYFYTDKLAGPVDLQLHGIRTFHSFVDLVEDADSTGRKHLRIEGAD